MPVKNTKVKFQMLVKNTEVNFQMPVKKYCSEILDASKKY